MAAVLGAVIIALAAAVLQPLSFRQPARPSPSHTRSPGRVERAHRMRTAQHTALMAPAAGQLPRLRRRHCPRRRPALRHVGQGPRRAHVHRGCAHCTWWDGFSSVPHAAGHRRRQAELGIPYYTRVYTVAAPAPVSQPPKEAGQGRPLQAYRCAPQRAGAYMPRTRAQTTIPFTNPKLQTSPEWRNSQEQSARANRNEEHEPLGRGGPRDAAASWAAGLRGGGRAHAGGWAVCSLRGP